jgi:hypothetical protein
MSAPDTKFLRRFQDHTLAKLLSEPLLQYVSIASMRKQVLLKPEQRVVPHLAGRNGKVGAGILINLPLADPMDADVPGAQLSVKLPIDILVADDLSLVLSNGAGITAEEVVIITWLLLNQYLNQALGSGNWTVAGFDPIEDRKGAYGYRLLLEVRFAEDQPDKVSAPTSVIAAGHATLSCATGGAAIYYTLDGSFPGPGNAAAILYAAPVVVSTGQQLLAAAYLANNIGSDVWQTIIP